MSTGSKQDGAARDGIKKQETKRWLVNRRVQWQTCIARATKVKKQVVSLTSEPSTQSIESIYRCASTSSARVLKFAASCKNSSASFSLFPGTRWTPTSELAAALLEEGANHHVRV